ncbi:MAG TPA: SAV_2336 N-terminal domain-related protein [Candidatus Margulisiibacteriota bacterium]|nr:SAV_2336 N-terminal domain-related protein [Candidatus Margulisiibacteriota bacterium]
MSSPPGGDALPEDLEPPALVPATEAWWKLVNALRALDSDAGFDELRDVLWLAQYLPRKRLPRTRKAVLAQEPAAKATAPANTDAGADADARASDSTGRRDTAPRLHPGDTRGVQPEEEQDARAALYAGSSQGAGSTVRRIRLPAPHPLPDALAIGRALLPVTRHRPSGPAMLLDEEATAEAIAHSDLPVPVLRQRRERWFDVLLAVDEASSMLAWRARIDEFEALLRRAGFRDVRRVSLRGAGGHRAAIDLRTPAGTLLLPDTRTPGAATASQLLLVVSDCAGAAWHDGRVSALLAPWAKVVPLAVVQTLPPPLWPHTAVGFAEFEMAATAPGQVTERLHEKRPDWAAGEPGLLLPMLALEEGAVRAWARMVMAAGDAWCRAALLPTTDALGDQSDVVVQTTSSGLLDSFRAASTPDALELAAAFAVIRPLNLPVMRLIQAVMLPEAGSDALPQILMSGLLHRTDTDKDATALPLRDEDIAYEIDDAVRDELATHLTRSRWWQVNLAVQRFVELETGVGFDFVAFIEDRLGLEHVAPSAMPFARLAARMAERFVPTRDKGPRARLVQRYREEPSGPKVLMLMWEIPPFVAGGTWTACFHLVRNLRTLGVDVTVVVPWQDSLIVSQPFDSDVRVVGLGIVPPELLRSPSRTGFTPYDLADDPWYGNAPSWSPYGGGATWLPYPSVTAWSPYSSGSTTWSPYSGGATWSPYSGGSTWSPYSGGSSWSPYSGGSGWSPYSSGATWSPYSGGPTWSPYSGGSSWSPYSGGSSWSPYSGGSGAITSIPYGTASVSASSSSGRGPYGGTASSYDGLQNTSALLDVINEARRRFVRFARSEPFDVLHAHDWVTFEAASAASKETGKPWIAHFHSIEQDRRPQQPDAIIERIEARVPDTAAAVLAPSHVTAGRIASRYGLSRDRITVAPNTLSYERIPPSELGRFETRRVLFLGRLAEQKGTDLFARVSLATQTRMANATFEVRGNGHPSPALQQANVIYGGNVEWSQRGSAFADISVLLVPSRSEPFGMVILEGMQHRVPVLYPRHAGAAEVLQSGVKIDPLDTQAVAEELHALLNDRNRWEHVVLQQAREIDQYADRGYARSLQELYSAVASNSATAHPL